MPITFSIDPAFGIALEVATGTLTASELLEAHTRRQACSVQKVLSDYLDATLDATTPELRMLAVALQAIEVDRGRRWAVVIRDQASFGLFRMLGAFLGPARMELNVFTERAEAREWLEGQKGMEVSGNA